MPNIGRPKIYSEDTRRVITVIPVSLVDALDEEAKVLDRSRQWLIIHLLKEGVKAIANRR